MRALMMVALLGAVLVGTNTARADEPQWIREDEAAALKVAAESGKLVLVDIWAEWCGWCHRLDDKVFNTPEFAEAAKDFVLLKIDSDANEGYLQKTGQRGLPTTAFLTPDGKVYFATAGYMWVPAYIGMMQAVNETYKAGGDVGELPAKISKLNLDNPDPELQAQREEAQRRRDEAAAKVEELVKATGLDYTKGEAGSLALTVDGVELSVAAQAGPEWTLLSVAHTWPKTEGDPAELAKAILAANANAGVGGFGLSRTGEVTLHEQVIADGLTADSTKALITAVAAVANTYSPGGTLARSELGAGDVGAIKALLTEAGFEGNEAPGGLDLMVGDAEVTVTVGTNMLELRTLAGLNTANEKVASLLPTLAQVSAVVGSARLFADEAGAVGVAFGVPLAGLNSAALKYYVENVVGLRASLLNWAKQQGVE